MDFSLLLHFFLLVPFAGFLLSLAIPGRMETLLSRVAFCTVGIQMTGAFGFTIYWVLHGLPTIDVKDIVIYKVPEYEFYLDFYFDKLTAVYLFVGAFLTFLVTIYSRYYLHREAGYKRFFNTVLFFYLGYTIAIFSGNLETLFVGWEILGISSFLLIAFYRDRYLPVKNAVKVFTVYRIGDIGLIVAMWMMHHLWMENITFQKLNNAVLVHDLLERHSFIGAMISLMILVTAAAKSAQLPFSSWLPRAMEGPTPSSAIFYGSLSVHLGVFILMRTFPFWEHQHSVRILIGVLGLTTTIITSGIARVQSSVKSQIAYASIAQIGLIFLELALGFENLALFHFAGNAFLRTYQLLVSPSVVSYLIREQFYNFTGHEPSLENTFPKKLEYTLYQLCVKEWNLDAVMYRFMWSPLKSLGNRIGFLSIKSVFIFFVPVYLVGLYAVYNPELLSGSIQIYLPYAFSLIGLMMVLRSFSERMNVFLSWILIIMNHFWVALAISFNEHFTFSEVHLYLSGIAVAGLIGLLLLSWLQQKEKDVNLDMFHGYSYRYPKQAFWFLICCLAVTGFPITPTFVGEDLIFTHIHENQFGLAVFTALSFMIDGIAVIRIYARVFMGPHVKSKYEIAYRSS